MGILVKKGSFAIRLGVVYFVYFHPHETKGTFAPRVLGGQDSEEDFYIQRSLLPNVP